MLFLRGCIDKMLKPPCGTALLLLQRMVNEMAELATIPGSVNFDSAPSLSQVLYMQKHSFVPTSEPHAQRGASEQQSADARSHSHTYPSNSIL